MHVLERSELGKAAVTESLELDDSWPTTSPAI
jgi:hypothetical protein